MAFAGKLSSSVTAGGVNLIAHNLNGIGIRRWHRNILAQAIGYRFANDSLACFCIFPSATKRKRCPCVTPSAIIFIKLLR